ncbi:hypothetical protein TSTA_123110 [Talaromyces stipitatus ATCC 10500]|uniref:Zn(2)-C6 fungal-type domain-containing protein n=1 Tax=Talaromyces stipitatus (strain ATCC 10500 / CBS 375.48 / QM 6759 / NRRL 1006) TaxID=441959 RepID=B8MCD5_TALSN|nr:uncharacterized protein TSTA_123110 [Talaromyces stipitatus ATCC 10500]EED18581.1 hypothetical protein TSTA_123110 [Talaromyces stipitatus ATCC 10500]
MNRNVVEAPAGAGAVGQTPSTTVTSRPAPYGRACVNCVRAKCKCILRNDGDNCERCFRLKKDCMPSSSVRKRRSTPRNPSQTARLEQKLDGLVSLLKANSQGSLSVEAIDASTSGVSANGLTSTGVAGGTTPSGASPQSPSRFGDGSFPSCAPSGAYGHDTSTHQRQNLSQYQDNHRTQGQSATIPITPKSTSSSSFAYPLPRDVEPTAKEADVWFHTFQTRYLEHVPFAIPYIKNTSSTQLRQDKPVLWLSVMAIACPFTSKQTNMGRAFKELIARELIVNGERSIDLLLGILTFTHWAYFFIHLGPLLTTMTHLAASIIVDLELDKPCQNEFSKHPGRQVLTKFLGKFSVPESRTMEHRRLVMATYCFSASCAFFHHKIESVSWSTYHEETLKLLEESKETHADLFQVTQVKFMHILSNVTRLYARIRVSENEATTQLIVPFIQALKSQLTTLQNQMPDYVAENKFVQLTCFYVEIAIHEIALVRVQYVPLAADRELECMECLLTCTRALRSWKDLFLSLGPTEYIGLPLTIWKQFALVLHTVMRLATLEDPAWNIEHVKQTVNLPAMFDVICSNLDYIATLEPRKSNSEDDVHRRSRKHMIGLMNWTNAVFAGIPAQPPPVENTYTRMNSARQEQSQAQTEIQTAQPATTTTSSSASSMLMMNGGTQQHSSTEETAAVLAQQMQTPWPPEMFPYFNHEPWTEDVFGFWDIYSGTKMYG